MFQTLFFINSLFSTVVHFVYLSRNAPESLTTVTVTPNSGAAVFKRESSNSQLNPSRPITLQVAAENSPPSSAPIPVPSQVAAYRRMQSNSPTSPLPVNKNINVVGSADKKVIILFILQYFFVLFVLSFIGNVLVL